jgi:hypothetical protein
MPNYTMLTSRSMNQLDLGGKNLLKLSTASKQPIIDVSKDLK